MTRFANDLLRLSERYKTTDLIANLHVRLEALSIDDQVLTCSVNDKPAANCWSVSVYSSIIDYGRDELVKLPSYQRPFVAMLRGALAAIFKLVEIDRIVGVGNDCLSTNLFSRIFKNLDMNDLTATALDSYPHHALMIRSLNTVHHRELMDKLQEAGWHFLVNRQVYLIDNFESALTLKNNQKDLKLLSDNRFTFRQLTAQDDFSIFESAEALYNLLYVDKYSQCNMKYKAVLLREMVAMGTMNLYLLEERLTGLPVGCLGMVEEGGILTVPVLGYDTKRPRKEALYRRLCIFAKRYCSQKGLRQHLSSGAASFKRSRGAEAHLEYVALYSRHLSLPKRLVWRLLGWLTRSVYARLLEKNQL